MITPYEEMMEMSALGAGVLETRSVELANNYNIPLI
jgi:aspartate kinase